LFRRESLHPQALTAVKSSRRQLCEPCGTTQYEMKSPIILQPGPAALTDGLKPLPAIIERVGQAITAA
jgi:hypothetical protein